jgi:hypothetical protein
MKSLKLKYLLIAIIALPAFCFAQCKTYTIGVKGDTLNCTDMQNRKQGKWVVHMNPMRGEPGYEMEGEFKDDKKTGPWRSYSLQGDLLAIENYRWGNKDGICDYYSLNGIEHEESWKAIDPKNPYDTVKVYDIYNPGKYAFKMVKVEATSVKQGTWTYYDPEKGTVIKTEDYVLDQVVDPTTGMPFNLSGNDTLKTVSLDTTKIKPPPEVLNYEKKNAKKKIQVRDGATGL